MRVLVQYGSNPSARMAAEEVAIKYLEDPASLSGDLGREALRVTSLLNDGALYPAYKNAYLTTRSEDLKSNILASMYFLDPEIVRAHLDFSLTDDVAAGDARGAIFYYSAILEDHAIIYAWLDENLDALLTKTPSVYHGALPQLLQSGCNATTLKQVDEFFADRGEMFATGLSRAMETMENCIARKARESAALGEFLAQYSE